jgi:uncharacterized protein (TIGR00251 family)
VSPSWLRPVAGGVELAVKVQPRAGRDEISGSAGGELKIKVSAPPVDSAANAALLRLLAGMLNCPRGSLRLVRGATARHKRIVVAGLTPDEVLRRLSM